MKMKEINIWVFAFTFIFGIKEEGFLFCFHQSSEHSESLLQVFDGIRRPPPLEKQKIFLLNFKFKRVRTNVYFYTFSYTLGSEKMHPLLFLPKELWQFPIQNVFEWICNPFLQFATSTIELAPLL